MPPAGRTVKNAEQPKLKVAEIIGEWRSSRIHFIEVAFLTSVFHIGSGKHLSLKPSNRKDQDDDQLK